MDKAGQGIVMRFAKIYPPQKMGVIVEKAKTYQWWEKNASAAFMKAVGEINRIEKGNPETKWDLPVPSKTNPPKKEPITVAPDLPF